MKKTSYYKSNISLYIHNSSLETYFRWYRLVVPRAHRNTNMTKTISVLSFQFVHEFTCMFTRNFESFKSIQNTCRCQIWICFCLNDNFVGSGFYLGHPWSIRRQKTLLQELDQVSIQWESCSNCLNKQNEKQYFKNNSL